MQKAYATALGGMAALAALLIGLTALAVTLDVVARNVGLGTLPWILEVSEYMLPLATFLVAPWLLRRNEHVRLDALLHLVGGRAGRALERAANGVGLAVCAVLVVYGARTIFNSAQQGAMVLKSVVFPEWWLYAPVPVCFLLLAFEFGRRIVAR
jgi:TRAP-type C4-dicarboxylate transport system permease small subunit